MLGGGIRNARRWIESCGHAPRTRIGFRKAHKVSTFRFGVRDEFGMRHAELLAKGGITSSDIATQGLGVQRALVLGQILPGVPVWQLGPETRYPGLGYIVFPGNVGGPQALAEVVLALQSQMGSVS